MMPFDSLRRGGLLARLLAWWGRIAWAGVCGAALAAGCTSPGVRPSGLTDEPLPVAGPTTRLVGDMAQSFGLQWTKVESVALVTNLSGQGSDPPPGTYRTLLTREMQSHEVKNTNTVLASPDTSLVLLVGYMPPGIQKGDRFDVQVSLPPGSETKGLRNGWLLQSRLRDLAVIENQLRNGHVLGLVQGHVLVEGVVREVQEPRLEKRAVVIAGGVAQQTRPLGMLLAQEHRSVQASAAIGNAINSRFHMYDRGQKQGVATPKNDSYIEIELLPRYKHNLTRYLRVIRSLAVKETPAQRGSRLLALEPQLLQPLSSAQTALRLEAIGKEAEPVLRKGLQSPDPEVRFYSAEALAYLDVADAAPELKQVALREPAFRWHALSALGAMDQIAAYEALSDLLHVASAETRCGALRTLSVRNPREPLLNGQALDNQFTLYAVPSSGEPLVHLSTSRQAEIAVFGSEMQITPREALFAGPQIVVKPLGPNQLRLSRFSATAQDAHDESTTRLVDVIQAVVKLGGTYSDALSLVLEGKRSGALNARVALDALPQAGRVFERGEGESPEPEALPVPAGEGVVPAGYTATENSPAGSPGGRAAGMARSAHPGTPLPSLFAPSKGGGTEAEAKEHEPAAKAPLPTAAEPESSGQAPGFFSRMGSWFRSPLR